MFDGLLIQWLLDPRQSAGDLAQLSDLQSLFTTIGQRGRLSGAAGCRRD